MTRSFVVNYAPQLILVDAVKEVVGKQDGERRKQSPFFLALLTFR